MAKVSGDNVYGDLFNEAGVHRVQRVPETESQNRVHTSTCTVALLPEVTEVDVRIDSKDLRVDVMRASGAGGQHVNTTESAVRITHLPTGITASCQDERSQLRNREKAMMVLRARIVEQEERAAREAEESARASMVGTGDRSERIRTYNFPQDRVTDHRLGRSIHAILEMMNGGHPLTTFVERLLEHQDRLKLEAMRAAIEPRVNPPAPPKLQNRRNWKPQF